MNTRKSQLTKSDQIYKPASKFETSKLVQSCKSISKGQILPKGNASIKENGQDGSYVQTNNSSPRQMNKVEKAITNPIIETNLKEKDLDYISKNIGEAIASVVIDEIFPLQGSNPVPL